MQTGQTIDLLGPLPLYQPLLMLGDSAKTVRCDIKHRIFSSDSAPLSPPPVTPSSSNSYDLSTVSLLRGHHYNTVISVQLTGYAVNV